MQGIPDFRGSWASVTLNQYRVAEFLANLFRRHGLVLSDEHRPSYGLWRKTPHGRDRRLSVGLDLEVKLPLGGHLATES